MTTTDVNGIPVANSGDRPQVEDLLGTLNHFLNTWSSHRLTLLDAINHKPQRAARIDPQVLQKMAVVMGDLGNVVSSRPQAPPPSPSLSPPQRLPGPRGYARARAVIEEVREFGSPTPRERDAIVAMIKTCSGTPLPIEALMSIARLSYRQLKRLPKSKLSHNDKLLISEMEVIKRREAIH